MLTKTHLDNIIKHNDLGTLESVSPLSGGDTSNCLKLTTERGIYVLKHPTTPVPEDFFAAEAAGLQAIAKTSTRTPSVVTATANYLLLEYLPLENKTRKFWIDLGEQLAIMHRSEAPYFGFLRDNYCGPTPQINTQESSGVKFFTENRLRPQARMASQRRLLNDDDLKQIDRLAQELPELIPEQKPVLVHGDLWTGNILCTVDQRSALIDPACYWGWAESDLAMTCLFGGFDRAFYESYQSNIALLSDWKARIEIYNLYHLLNHLNLFGTSYYPAIKSTLNRYAGQQTLT